MHVVQMRGWVDVHWASIISYKPMINILMNEWFSFHFLHLEDVDLIQGLPWVCDRSYWSLQQWSLGFNPLKEVLRCKLVCVKLPSLPLEL